MFRGKTQKTVRSNFGGGGGGGGGYLTKFNTGGSAQGPTPYSFICHFGRRGTCTPFIYLLYPFHIPTCCHFHVVFNKKN